MKFKDIYNVLNETKNKVDKYDDIMSDNTLTTQQKYKAVLERQPIPYFKIDVYGNQVVIETYSEESANNWKMFLQRHKLIIRGTTKSKRELKKPYTDRKGRYKKYTMDDMYTVFARFY